MKRRSGAERPRLHICHMACGKVVQIWCKSEAGLTGEADIHAEPGLITVRPVESPRKGWAEAAAEHPSEGLLDEPTPTEFDTEEWIW